jgi:ANTAR domain
MGGDQSKKRALEEYVAFLEEQVGIDAVREDHLTKAVRRRDLIGQAKGILMEREGCTGDEAFRLLGAISLQLNRPTLDVAAAVVKEVETRSFRTRFGGSPPRAGSEGEAAAAQGSSPSDEDPGEPLSKSTTV